MRDVLGELVAREQAELGVVDDAAGHGLLLVVREQCAEHGLAGQDEREHETAVHVEVGEDAEHAEDVGAELVALVEQEHGPAALLVRDLGRAFKRQRTCSPLEGDGSAIERDASVFATELLMPTPLVTPMCRVALKSLDPVRAIASAFQTSMYASARRFVELTPERCAVVITKQGRVQWVQKSSSFSAWIPSGRSVNPASAAFDYFDRGKLDESPRVIPASTWCASESLGTDASPVYEHATAIPEAGTVFSLLWMPRAA